MQDKVNEILAIVGTQLTHQSFFALDKAITHALESVEEETRSKCASLVLECKNNLDQNGNPGFVKATECVDKIMSSRDTKIGDYA